MTQSAAVRPDQPLDDRVLRATRWLAAGIVPFLVAGFVILYLVPERSGQLFAWPIAPTLTAMVLAAAYAGGVWFFVSVLRTRQWHTVAAGFPAVVVFAALLGVTTFVHWDRFTHGHVAFWVWTVLYVVAPFLVAGVWFVNRRTESAARPDEPRLGPWLRGSLVALGVVTVAFGVVLELVPAQMSYVWPWALTSLTARVIGAVLCLGVAAFGVLHDDRCTAVVRMVEVALVMAVLVAAAVVRARDQVMWSRPLAWVMVAVLILFLVGGAALLARLRRSVSSIGAGVL
jgi:hypothetical protein